MSSKTKVLLLVSGLLYVCREFCQRGVRMAYVDMEYILENVDEYRDATSS